MSKTLLEMSTEIISAQVRHQTMTADQIADCMRSVFSTLQGLEEVSEGLEKMRDDSSEESLNHLRQNPLKSIQRNQIICLESGKPYKLLSNRHLALYNMTPREYKKKWGIPMTMALSARTLTNRRRKLAKDLGMGKQLAEWRAKRKKDQEQVG